MQIGPYTSQQYLSTNPVTEISSTTAVDKGNAYTVKEIYETQVGWEIPLLIIVLHDGSRYSFSDYQFYGEVDLKKGSTVYIYPMSANEQDHRRGKFFNAINWLEDEHGNRWRLYNRLPNR